jgi:hypothetical protein
MLIFVIPRTKNQSITVKGNNIALGFATASTQEGNSHAFTVSIILYAELIWTAAVTDLAYSRIADSDVQRFEKAIHFDPQCRC